MNYPSAQFPAYPQLEFEAFEDWQPIANPDALVALRRDLGPREFSPNVIINVTRRKAGLTLDELGQEMQHYLARSMPEAKLVLEQNMSIAERDWHIVELTQNLPEAGSVYQIIALTPVMNGNYSDVVRVVGSAAGADEANRQAIRKLISTIIIKTV